MDFLKSCSTNVYAVEDLLQTRYCRYENVGESLSELEAWTRIHDTLAGLRAQNVLCCSAGGHLYVFGDIDEAQESLLDPYNAVEDDVLDSMPPRQLDDGTPLHQVLILAIELGIAFALAKNDNVLHIAPWTWLYAPVHEDGSSSPACVMTLHMTFTPIDGLFLVPEIKPTDWDFTAEDVDLGSEVLVAPSGSLAAVSPGSDDTVTGDLWKTSVARAMQCEGVHLSTHARWAAVQPLSNTQSKSFLWPARLLLAHHKAYPCKEPTIFESPSWRSWFGDSEGVAAFRNPWALIEQWHDDRDTRNGAKDTDSVPGIHNSITSVVDKAATMDDEPHMTSPTFTQRSIDQHAAVGGIYPTPPDGLTQHQQNMSTGPVTSPYVTQGEFGVSTGDNLPTNEDTQFRSPGLGDTADFVMEQDELFGDTGEMEFGENEVGDADFSFFDEPDDVANIAVAESSDIQEMPNQQADSHTKEPNIQVTQHGLMEDTDQGLRDAEHLPLSPIGHSDRPEHDPERVGALASLLHPQADPLSLEKPLSPFGIRERLLPPPVPASVSHIDSSRSTAGRRNSTFNPVTFRENPSLGSKYALPKEDAVLGMNVSMTPEIGLPAVRKKTKLPKLTDGRESDDSSEESDSECDLSESSSEEDAGLPPKLPWDNRKRKRQVDSNGTILEGMQETLWTENTGGSQLAPHSGDNILGHLQQHFSPQSVLDGKARFRSIASVASVEERLPKASETLLAVDSVHDLRNDDLVYVAQIITEQAATSVDIWRRSLSTSASLPDRYYARKRCAYEKLIRRAIEGLIPSCEACDLAKVSLTRESQQQSRSLTGTAKGSQPLPRLPQRTDSIAGGPDYFPLQLPYVRVQRGADTWEMLSTCLSFWETLGLGPANGPKNVRGFCVFPQSQDLRQLVGHFLADLGTAYESCRLGSHVHVRHPNENDDLDSYDDGMAPVELGDDSNVESALKSYAAVCATLGRALSHISHQEAERTIVVYIVNPFPGRQAQHHLCACFWILFKTYRDNLPKAHRSQCSSDVVLQLLPIDLIAAFDMVVVPDAKQMATLAREVYDRCPPPAAMQAEEHASQLSILAAPSVELASAAPKRIGFQLAADPPSDLLHEGSILHLAYSWSTDMQWLTAVWLDNTGQSCHTAAFCLRGRSFASAAEDIWDRTREIIAARRVTWRIFIVTPDTIDRSVSLCWRSLSSRPRQQHLCVTLLSVQSDLELRVSPADNAMLIVQDQWFPTPVSTPQASTFTSSPDVGGHLNAPPTPAPSESAAVLAENDTDAHLFDLADESWGVMLSPKVMNLSSHKALANAALFKRGVSELQAEEALPSLGVGVHWTIQVKPSSIIDEGSVKQAELTLREVLRMYRNLSMLTKARGLEEQGRSDLSPLHVAAATRGAHSLDGMLRISDY